MSKIASGRFGSDLIGQWLEHIQHKYFDMTSDRSSSHLQTVRMTARIAQV